MRFISSDTLMFPHLYQPVPHPRLDHLVVLLRDRAPLPVEEQMAEEVAAAEVM
tara:strand:- start:370 stop:528 length:159 start_codon:yes stop_codon:yes gene_type:complete